MKECFRAILALILISFYFLPGSVSASDTNTTSTGLGLLVFSHVKESQNYTSGLDAFEIYNSGGSAIDATITGTDLEGGINWVLSNTCTADNDTYGLLAGLDGQSYNVTVKSSSPELLISNLASLSSQKFGLQLCAPTLFSDGVAKTGNITLTVTAH